MRIQLIETLTDLEPYHTHWNELLQNSPTNTVFQTFEWLAAWWDVFGGDYRLQIVLGFAGDRLVAAAPLVLGTRHGYTGQRTCLEFASIDPSDYADFLYRDPQYLRALLAAIQTDILWDEMVFDRIPALSPTVQILTAMFPGWRATQFPCDISAAYLFSPTQDGSEILRKKSIRRHVNGLKKVGNVSVQHLTQAADILPLLTPFFAQHIERRALTAAPSLFLDPRQQHFYHGLTQRLAPRQWVLFTIIRLNADAVAFHYGLLYERKLLWYKPSFSAPHAHLSPGEVLLAELFAYCQANKIAELDFTIGENPFKERFTNVRRPSIRFQTYRSSFRQQLGYADRLLRERAKRVYWIRQVYGGWHSLWQ